MFQTIFVEPLHNALVFLVNIIPGHDVGFAIIILTILVKFVLSPLHKKTIKGQFEMKQLEPKIKKLKELYPDKQEQAQKTFELYKEHKVNPLSGCLPVLIQIPIILALYRLFIGGFNPDAHTIYSFISKPETFNLNFLGLVNLGEKSLVFAIIAGVTQFLQAKFSMARMNNVDKNDDSMQANMSRMMSKQMKYFLPVFIGIVAYQISAAVPLYWAVNNIFSTIQEILIHKKLSKKTQNIEEKS
ncbi:MAG: membrane protein insertase YidC [Bacteroidetes bacterium]|nr:membrane protein insertase YidC [Bacteroidota bacterium]